MMYNDCYKGMSDIQHEIIIDLSQSYRIIKYLFTYSTNTTFLTLKINSLAHHLHKRSKAS